MKFLRSLCVMLALACALPIAALAQQTMGGSIDGTVTDPNGAVVPGAKVIATNVTTGVKNNAQTTQGGLYAFPLLLPGPYTITVEQTGFKTYLREGIEVRLGMSETIDIKLELGTVQQQVEVKGAAPVLTTDSPTISTNITPQQLDTMPIWWGGSMRLADNFQGYLPSAKSNSQFSINGGVGRAIEYMIDGGSIISPESGGTAFYFPGMEPYAETNVITSGPTADIGRSGGGWELFTSKSGTNDVHGSMFYNFERQIFNANSWSGNQNTAPSNFSCFGAVQTYACRPKVRYNDEGGSAGGPVYIPHLYDGRNRTFWFFTFEGYWQPASVTSQTGESVPTAAETQGNFQGIYGATTPVLYDPLTTSPGPRTPFGTAGAYNIIPTGRFSNISSKFLPFIPGPDTGSGASPEGDYYFNETSVITDKDWSLKLDHTIHQKHHLAFFYTYRYEPTNVTQDMAGPLSDGLVSTIAPHQFRGSWDWVATPHVVIHSYWSGSFDNVEWHNPLQNGYGCKLGFTEDMCGTNQDATPYVQFAGGADAYTTWGMTQGKVDNGGQTNHILMEGQSLTWTRNKHEFKMGWEIRRSATLNNDWSGTNGTYTFSNAQTASVAGSTTTGDSFASFLLGMPGSAYQAVPPPYMANIRYAYTAGYFMDTWKIKPNLTFDLGIRYEVPINWHYANGGDSSFSIITPNPAADNLPGALIYMGYGAGHTGTLRPYPTDFSDIGPRTGFAWRATQNTVVRGSFGLIYEGEGNGDCGCTDGYGNGAYSQGGDGFDSALFANGTEYTWDSTVTGSPGVNPQAGYTPAQQLPGVDDFSAGSNEGNPMYMGPKFGVAPRIYDMNLTIQRQYKGWLFQIGYVGQRTHQAAGSDELNVLPAADLHLMSTPTVQNVAASAYTGAFTVPANTNLLSWSFNNATQGPELNALGYFAPSGVNSNNPTCAGWQICWTTGWGGQATLFQALRPYPQTGVVNDNNAGDGWVSYDSLQIIVEHRFGDLNLESSYVRSKNLNIDVGSQIFGYYQGTQANQDPDNRADNKSFANNDYPNIINFMMSYNLPFGRGKKFFSGTSGLVNRFIGGWNVAGVGQYRSGALIEILSPTSNLTTYMGWEITKADFTGAPIKTNTATNSLNPDNYYSRWFTTATNTADVTTANPSGITGSASFIQAPIGTEGNSSIYNNQYRQPWFRNENIGINKMIGVWGEGKVSLRYSLQINNFFNRTDFGSITTSLTSSNFGRPGGAADGARQMSMGLRLFF